MMQNLDGDYTEEEVAALLKKKLVTLRKDRYRKLDHPPYRKTGARVTYPKREFHAWHESKVVHPRRDTEKTA